MLYEGLTSTLPSGDVELALAESYELSEDKKTYTFILKEAYWSNGERITAHDFEYTWKSILDPAFPSMSAYLLYPIQGAQKIKEGILSKDELGVYAIDDTTLKITLNTPTPYFLNLVSFITFFPVPCGIDEINPEWGSGKTTIVNGPYSIEGWEGLHKIILKKNPNYWDQESLGFKEIYIHRIPDETLSLNLFEKKEIDYLGGTIAPIPLDAIPALKKRDELHIEATAGTYFTCFNCESFPFSNRNIRRAFGLAIDRQQLSNHVSELNEEVALELIPTVMKRGFATKPQMNDNDAAGAIEAFEQGLKELNLNRDNFPKVKFLYSNTSKEQKIAQALQQKWQNTLGISVSIERMNFLTLLHALSAHQFEFALGSFMCQYNDPNDVLERFYNKKSSKNYSQWENKEYQYYLNEARLVSDFDKRMALYQKAEEIMHEEMPVTPILYKSRSMLINREKLKETGNSPTRLLILKGLELNE